MFLLFFSCYVAHRDLHSFPTRRSSDLACHCMGRQPYSKRCSARDSFFLAIFTLGEGYQDRKSTRLNSSHRCISYAVFCLKKKTTARHVLDRPDENRAKAW